MRILRSFLFSKWFFALLFFISVFDLATDVAARTRVQYWASMNAISIGLSALVAVLAAWLFLDLHTRKPR